MGELGDVVIGISLGSSTVMTFVHPKNGMKVRVKLPRRSAYCMSGDALNIWRHKINGRDVTRERVSITMRQVRRLYLPESVNFNIDDGEEVMVKEFVDVNDGFRLRNVVKVKCDEDEVKRTAKLHGFDGWL